MDSENTKKWSQILDLKRKTLSRKCFHFSKNECEGEIIEAHSIQKEKILKKLSIDGHIVMLKRNFRELVMDNIGKKQATIFSGICYKHDNEFFKDIETIKFSNTLKQKTLYAYRAYIKELHAKNSAVNFMSSLFYLYADTWNLEKEIMEYTLKGQKLGRDDLFKYEVTFKNIFENNNFDKLCTHVIKFDREYGLAVSSTISFPYDFKGNRLDHLKEDLKEDSKPLFLTIFPEDGCTYVLISFFKQDENFYDFLKEQIINKSIEVQKKLLTNLVIANCENLVFSPACWNKLSNRKRDLFMEKYIFNLYNDFQKDELSQDPGINIFIDL